MRAIARAVEKQGLAGRPLPRRIALTLRHAGGFQFATLAGASAGASGGQHDASTVDAGGYHKGMAVFTVAKGGLMYEASVGGQKFSYTPLK